MDAKISSDFLHGTSFGHPIEKAATVDSCVAVAEVLEGRVSHFCPSAPQAGDNDGNVVGIGRRFLKPEPLAEVAVRQAQSRLQLRHLKQ